MLSDKLKKLRKTTKFTQHEFAKKIDVARTTYAMYEQGHREPDYEILQKIATFYSVSTDYLLGITENPSQIDNEEKEFENFINDPDLERWYKELPKSKEDDLRKLRKMWDIIKNDK